MKLLVTGANGFIGANLVRKLIGLNYDVIALTRSEVSFKHPKLKNILIDLSEINTLTIDDDIDVFFHVAATINFNNSAESIAAIANDNIIVNYQLADFVVRHKIKKVILSSSCSVYEENFNSDTYITEDSTLRPLNLYAVSKLAGEWILENRLKGLVNELVILRYSSVYGFGQKENSILPIFIQQALNNNAIKIFGSGNRIQDYIYIDDVIQANVNAMNVKLPFGTILNIGSGYPVTDAVLAKTIVKIWDSKADVLILNQNNNAETIFNYSIQKAQKMIDFEPLKLEDGLKLYKGCQNQFT